MSCGIPEENPHSRHVHEGVVSHKSLVQTTSTTERAFLAEFIPQINGRTTADVRTVCTTNRGSTTEDGSDVSAEDWKRRYRPGD